VHSVAAHSLEFKRRSAALFFGLGPPRMPLERVAIKFGLSLAVIHAGFNAAHPTSAVP
jgi:hypothetical protein